MASISQKAAQVAADTVALLNGAEERGDVAQSVVQALRTGHILHLLADASHAALAGEVAGAVRRRFASDRWPPLLTITPDTEPLALIGRDYAVARPLAQQTHELVRQGDVVLIMAGARPSADLVSAAYLAGSQGAVVVGLGLPATAIEADPSITLPEAPAERLVECQFVLGSVLAETLARELPAKHPPDLEPALERFGCINCDASLVVPRHLAGRRGMCPYCYNNTILAPDSPAAENEMRTHMRFSLRGCQLCVSLAPEAKPPVPLPGELTLENLSPGGLLFSITGSRVEIQPGDALLVEITTPAFNRPLSLEGVVNRVTREDQLHHVGVVFRELAPAAAERLRVLESNLVLRRITLRSAQAAESATAPSPAPAPNAEHGKPSP